jgi:hypothetical protein
MEQGTVGLIRPVTINLCGLVLSRFSSGLPRKFRGGVIRGFLRETLALPEVRNMAERIIPYLITDNVIKRPRTIMEVAQATHSSNGLFLATHSPMAALGGRQRALAMDYFLQVSLPQLNNWATIEFIWL